MRLLAALLSLSISISGPGSVYAQAELGLDPGLDELGFTSAQTQADPARQALLDERTRMLKTHQTLGLVNALPLTLALGTSGGNKTVHASLGATATILYGFTAYYAWKAPKPEGIEDKGKVRVHKLFMWVHIPAMILTAALGAGLYSKKDGDSKGITRKHPQAATTAIVSYFGAMGSVMIKF